MPLSPLEHDRRYGELDQVMRAYLGQPADDTPEQPGPALTAYLRHTWHTRPWALATAERQLREYADNPPGRLRLRLGEFYAIPDVGLPQGEIQSWLRCLADHIKHSIETGEVPPPGVPATHWEWHARFPELGQFLGDGSPRTCRTSSTTIMPPSRTTGTPPTATSWPASSGNCRNCLPWTWTSPTSPSPSRNSAWRSTLRPLLAQRLAVGRRGPTRRADWRRLSEQAPTPTASADAPVPPSDAVRTHPLAPGSGSGGRPRR